MKAEDIKYIVIHCTAGFAPANRVQAYFKRPKQEGGRGWNTGGYHIIIDRDGKITQFYPFGKVTNGVKGFNQKCIHISYVGGVHSVGGAPMAKDTRNALQKKSIIKSIRKARAWLKKNGKDISKNLQIVGHRDFSYDKNKDNDCKDFKKISSFRRIIRSIFC